EAALAGDLQLRAGEVWVVLDDQHDAVAVLDVVTIVADVARKEQCRVELRLVVIVCRRLAASVAVARQHDCRLERNGGIRMLRRLVRGRQEQREPAAPTDLALKVGLVAEQARDLPADRVSEAGAAVTTARRPVGLLKGLEDQAQLVVSDTDAGVVYVELQHGFGPRPCLSRDMTAFCETETR